MQQICILILPLRLGTFNRYLKKVTYKKHMDSIIFPSTDVEYEGQWDHHIPIMDPKPQGFYRVLIKLRAQKEDEHKIMLQEKKNKLI